MKVSSYFEKLFTAYYSLFTQKGFTLIELVMIIVLLAIAIPVLLIMLGQGAKQSVNAELEIAATNVGQAMMEEIRSKQWDHNSPIPPGAYTNPLAAEGVEARTVCTGNPSSYNDIDDYNSYNEPCTWGGVQYTTSVVVCYVQAAALDACVAGPTDYKRVQVTVTNATVGSAVLVTVMTNY